MSEERELDNAELARVLTLYEGPPTPRTRGTARARRTPSRPVIVLIALVVIAVVGAAALGVIAGRDRNPSNASIAANGCTTTLAVAGRHYVARAIPSGRPQLGRSLGDGILRTCGSPRHAGASVITGVDPRAAVGLRGKAGLIYVAGPCARASAARLLSCLRAQ